MSDKMDSPDIRPQGAKGGKIVLYTTDDGKAQVSLMSRDGRFWFNQKQMKELDQSVVKCYLTTDADGESRKVT